MNFNLFSKPKTLRAALLATTILGFTIPAANAENDALKVVDPIRTAFQTQYGQRFDTGKLIRYLNRLFAAVDFDRAGLDATEITLYGKMQKAALRSQVASRVLRYDLDGDTIVTRAEIETFLLARQRRYRRVAKPIITNRIRKSVDKLMLGDPNNDGRLEVSEYDALAKSANYGRYTRRRDHSGAAMALLKADPNKDGIVTQIEGMNLLGRAFQGVKITPPARGGFRTRTSCKAPKAAENAQIVVAGTYGGDSVPTVTIAGQNKETSTGKVVIEEGKEPIYLVMTSFKPMIWRLSGATDRISHVLVTGLTPRGLKPQAGVTGVAKNKVSFLSARDCVNAYYKLSGITEAKIKAQVFALTGRTPEKLVGYRTLQELQIPSGRNAKSRIRQNGNGLTIVKGDTVMEILTDEKKPTVKIAENSQATNNLERRLLRYKPGGVVKINAKSVVSDAPVADYKVLPQQAGLLQLVTSGALEVISKSEYRIVKEMRYPAGLTGGFRQKFLLKKGVPEPTGNPGRSCVFSEDKGGFIAGRCR